MQRAITLLRCAAGVTSVQRLAERVATWDVQDSPSQ